MNRRARTVKEILDTLFPHPKIPLKHDDPYTLLIGVVLSARCTDKRVNEVTPELFALAATPEAMAQVAQSAIQSIIKPCGLSPTKSKAIKGLSKILVEEHGGRCSRRDGGPRKAPGSGAQNRIGGGGAGI